MIYLYYNGRRWVLTNAIVTVREHYLIFLYDSYKPRGRGVTRPSVYCLLLFYMFIPFINTVSHCDSTPEMCDVTVWNLRVE